jgi:hypothetical protein
MHGVSVGGAEKGDMLGGLMQHIYGGHYHTVCGITLHIFLSQLSNVCIYQNF